MRSIKIVADSSCDIFQLENICYSYAPMKIITEEREFSDDASLNIHEMVEFLSQYRGKSQSSCPNTNDWLEAFGDAEDIFCVTITSGLSGSHNSACLAKQLYEEKHPDRRVHVFDSLSAGPEIALIIEKIEEDVLKGLQFEAICHHITEYMKNTGLVFMLKSLTTFANNGRVSPVVAKLVGITGICIVGKASNQGTLEPMHKYRGEKKAVETLVNVLKKEGCSGRKISIGHCQNESAAEMLKELILQTFQDAQIEIHKLKGLCSFYAEKGGILIGFEKA